MNSRGLNSKKSLRLVLHVTVGVIALMLFGCSLPPKPGQFSRPDDANMRRYNNISEAHAAKLQQDFTGREFVFRRSVETKGPDKKTRLKIASGTVARVTGLNTTSYNQFLVMYETEAGLRGSIWFQAADKPFLAGTKATKLTDEIATASWVERNLEKTIEFIKTPALLETDVTLPSAKPGLSLTAPPVTSGQIAPVEKTQTQIINLRAYTEPHQVARGGTVKLVLSFKVEGGETTTHVVKETWDLQFDGKSLSKYPVTRKRERVTGEYTSSYRQRIPGKATTGMYRYHGEVCMANACSSQSVVFDVLP